MTDSVVVRYRTKPEYADENARLIGEVFAELARTNPEGFTYRTFRLADGVSFVHTATITAGTNPLATSAAFAAFQEGIADRCEEGPAVTEATEVGSFG